MDEYFIIRPPGRNFTVSDYLHSAIPNLKSYDPDNKDFTLLIDKTISSKRFKKLYNAEITFEPLQNRKLTISKDASEEVFIELLVNGLKEELHTIDLQLYLEILIWEENVFAKAATLNLAISPNLILFEKVFTFIKTGYSTKYRILVDIFGMPINIYFGFEKYFDPNAHFPIK
jgi:hypothetical protein